MVEEKNKIFQNTQTTLNTLLLLSHSCHKIFSMEKLCIFYLKYIKKSLKVKKITHSMSMSSMYILNYISLRLEFSPRVMWAMSEGPQWSRVVMGTLSRGWCHAAEVWRCHAPHHRPAINCHVSLTSLSHLDSVSGEDRPRVMTGQWEVSTRASNQSGVRMPHPSLSARQSDTNLTA